MWSPHDFPRLVGASFRVTSPETPEYNCIAWAAGTNDRWWWPEDPFGVAYWPPGVARETTLAAFTSAYATLGYEPCDSPGLEEGFEKIALYVIGNNPTHAARQLPSGLWTSKLGPQEDIEHTLEAVEGPAYGRLALVLKRSR